MHKMEKSKQKAYNFLLDLLVKINVFKNWVPSPLSSIIITQKSFQQFKNCKKLSNKR